MIIHRQSEERLRPDQVRAMARGFYHLAEIDELSDEEKQLIENFLKEGGVDLDLETLAKIPFSVESLAYSLDTIFLRKTFLKICILLIRTDGIVKAEEMEELRRLAQALQIDEPLELLAADLDNKKLT